MVGPNSLISYQNLIAPRRNGIRRSDRNCEDTIGLLSTKTEDPIASRKKSIGITDRIEKQQRKISLKITCYSEISGRCYC